MASVLNSSYIIDLLATQAILHTCNCYTRGNYVYSAACMQLSNFFPKAKVGSKESKRNRNTKPQAEQGQRCREGENSGSQSTSCPRKNVEYRENGKDYSRHKSRGQQTWSLPGLSSHHCMCACVCVAIHMIKAGWTHNYLCLYSHL